MKSSWKKILGQSIIVILLVVFGAVIQDRYSFLSLTPLAHNSSSGSFSSSTLPLITNGETPADFAKKVDMSVFWQTWRLLEDEYYLSEKIDPQKMVDGAVAGMVSALGDPYTAYLPPKELERSGQDLAGSFYGVGIELGFSEEGILSVMAPLDGTPAQKAGLQPNDLILNVNDPAKNINESTSGWSLEKAVDTIRGAKGTPVTLTLLRKNGEGKPFEVELIRDEIIIKSVTLEFIEKDGKKIAHLKLSRFGERTEAEWNTAVQEILANQSQLNGIVLDMRNNPGGLFDAAQFVASEFIDSGVIVSQKGKTMSRDFVSQGRHRLSSIPTVVLINGGSASASEIVAGALKDRKNIIIVGEKSFGKGTVQDRQELPNGGGVHITIAQWLTPNGTWIHESGILPDVEIKDDLETEEVDEALDKAIEQLKK